MARKKKKDEVENYFNNVANYQTEAEARAVTPEGVKVFCAFDELVPIGKVVPNPGNPNTHPPKQVALLAAIIKGQGWRKPITVSKRSGFVVTGHGRLEAAQSMQASVVPVEYQEYASEAEEYADLMADNRLAELSEMNTSALADMLQQMDTGEIPLEMSGYTEEDLEDLLNALGGVDDTENNGEDTVPPPKNIPMTHAGDIWHLGQHRLICGDSTKPETLQKLLGDELAQCVNTDPPYGISLDGGGGNGKRQKQQIENNGMIANDELTDDDLLGKLLIPAFKNAVKYSKPDAAFYIYHATDTRRDFEDAMTAAGLLEKQYLIWLKNNHNLSGTDYLRDFEPMCKQLLSPIEIIEYLKWREVFYKNNGPINLLITETNNGFVLSKPQKNENLVQQYLYEKYGENAIYEDRLYYELFRQYVLVLYEHKEIESEINGCYEVIKFLAHLFRDEIKCFVERTEKALLIAKTKKFNLVGTLRNVQKEYAIVFTATEQIPSEKLLPVVFEKQKVHTLLQVITYWVNDNEYMIDFVLWQG